MEWFTNLCSPVGKNANATILQMAHKSFSRHFTHNLIGNYLSFFQIKRTLLVCLYHIALNIPRDGQISTHHLFFKYMKAEISSCNILQLCKCKKKDI